MNNKQYIEFEARNTALNFLENSIFIDLNGFHNSRLLCLLHGSNEYFDLFLSVFNETVKENRDQLLWLSNKVAS